MFPSNVSRTQKQKTKEKTSILGVKFGVGGTGTLPTSRPGRPCPNNVNIRRSSFVFSIIFVGIASLALYTSWFTSVSIAEKVLDMKVLKTADLAKLETSLAKLQSSLADSTASLRQISLEAAKQKRELTKELDGTKADLETYRKKLRNKVWSLAESETALQSADHIVEQGKEALATVLSAAEAESVNLGISLEAQKQNVAKEKAKVKELTSDKDTLKRTVAKEKKRVVELLSQRDEFKRQLPKSVKDLTKEIHILKQQLTSVGIKV